MPLRLLLTFMPLLDAFIIYALTCYATLRCRYIHTPFLRFDAACRAYAALVCLRFSSRLISFVAFLLLLLYHMPSPISCFHFYAIYCHAMP